MFDVPCRPSWPDGGFRSGKSGRSPGGIAGQRGAGDSGIQGLRRVFGKSSPVGRGTAVGHREDQVGELEAEVAVIPHLPLMNVNPGRQGRKGHTKERGRHQGAAQDIPVRREQYQ
jgi:hypothetical protein